MDDCRVPGAPGEDVGGNARRLGASATAWMDTLWDPEPRLLRHPAGRTHMVRETSWYALGLLSRGGAGDVARAIDAIDAVLTHQFDTPGAPHHGTWRRRPDEPDPPAAGATEWCDYDPNWREFIGCALLLVLHEFESAAPPALLGRIEHALSLAVDGARARAVPPSYTNIALMGAYLFDAVGHRQGAADLRRAGELLARQVHDLWSLTCSFPEFNSPTYYGVDLFALALWRRCAPSAELRRLGTEMDERLWREIGMRYHPALRNMAGPFDRAYGMDMRRYVALLGLWIGPVVGAGRAPLPAAGPSAGAHAHDWCFAPCVALLAAAPPAEVVARLSALPEERRVTTTIGGSPRRVATSWIGPRHTVGSLDAAGSRNDAGEQYCPAVVHWSAPDGVNWLRVAPGTPVDATVDEAGALHLTWHDTDHDGARLRFEARTEDDPVELTGEQWRLPGLTVRLSAAVDVVASRSGELLRIECVPRSSGPFRLTLHICAALSGPQRA